MGKPEVQVVKATLVYDGIAHDLFASQVEGSWFATHDAPAIPDGSELGPFDSASEVIGFLAADIVTTVGVVIQ